MHDYSNCRPRLKNKMNEQFDFRALLIKLQDCLTDNDRRRLHFIVGDTIPRYLRDDPSLSGTLSLLESLFDQAKISEQDFDYLIYAFNEIHCYEGVKRLRGIISFLLFSNKISIFRVSNGKTGSGSRWD